jgi:hypothetical protein
MRRADEIMGRSAEGNIAEKSGDTMKRRDFIKLSALTAGAIILPDYASVVSAKEVSSFKVNSDSAVKAMEFTGSMKS